MDVPNIRLIVGDPSPIVLCGIQAICAADDKIELSSSHLRIESVRAAIEQERPSLVLMDWNLVVWEEAHSDHAFTWVSQHCPFAFLTMAENFGHGKLALRLGARGVISKRSSAQEFRKAIWEIVRGGTWKPNPGAAAFQRDGHPAELNFDEEIQRIRLITPREREIMLLISQGKRNKQIAAELRIAESTVTHHLTAVFGKVRVSDRLGLSAFVHRHYEIFATPELGAHQGVLAGSLSQETPSEHASSVSARPQVADATR